MVLKESGIGPFLFRNSLSTPIDRRLKRFASRQDDMEPKPRSTSASRKSAAAGTGIAAGTGTGTDSGHASHQESALWYFLLGNVLCVRAIPGGFQGALLCAVPLVESTSKFLLTLKFLMFLGFTQPFLPSSNMIS
jgi:hypothetical protein